MIKILSKITILSSLFWLVACSINTRFDNLFYNHQYEEAYSVLTKSNNKNSLDYQERLLKVLFQLAMQDTEKYIALLDNAMLSITYSELSQLQHLIKSWVRFLSAKNNDDYQNIIAIIPTTKFEEANLEQMRLIMYTTSLIKLTRFQEARAILKMSDLLKKSSDLSYLAGIANFKLKQFSEAQKMLWATVALSQNEQLLSLTYYHLGKIAEHEKNPKKMQELFHKSWKYNPFFAEVNVQLGKIAHEKSYSELHNRYYRAALRLNENVAEAWYYLTL